MSQSYPIPGQTTARVYLVHIPGWVKWIRKITAAIDTWTKRFERYERVQ